MTREQGEKKQKGKVAYDKFLDRLMQKDYFPLQATQARKVIHKVRQARNKQLSKPLGQLLK